MASRKSWPSLEDPAHFETRYVSHDVGNSCKSDGVHFRTRAGEYLD